MKIQESQSYKVGLLLGELAKEFAAWREDCPIKSFEKSYVGTLSRRITTIPDLIRFKTFMEEKLILHERASFTHAISANLSEEIKALESSSSEKYDRHKCAFGFFDSYFASVKQDNATTKTQDNQLAKSEILFLYESTYSIPNGDPFTGEQRYDEETKKVLVSDVRIKRFIRDFLDANGNEIYVLLDRSNASKDGKESGAAARIKTLKQKYPNQPAKKVLKQCIDVRLFGGISTEEGDAANITGPVQFALLNPSLNEVDLRMHQNTCVFPSQIKNAQGTIGTTTVVPYCVNQIHGWINPYSAKHTGLGNSQSKYSIPGML